GQPRLLPAFPELRLEGVVLMRLCQLKKEVDLLGQDDRLDVFGQPAPVVLRQGLDPVGSLLGGKLGKGRRLAQARRSGKEKDREKEAGTGWRLHQMSILTPPLRAHIPLRK